MKCFDYFCLAFTRYSEFKGRSRRYEYFSFVIGNFFLLFSLRMLDFGLHLSFLAALWQLVILIPSIAVAVRRAHDSNKSGWFMLVPVYNIILMLQPGNSDANNFGPSPKDPDTYE